MIQHHSHRRPLTLVAALLLGAASIAPAWAGSETPPEGPPWVRSLAEAQRLAIEKERPIFVYLTKTH
jgi:hypothetical protein